MAVRQADRRSDATGTIEVSSPAVLNRRAARLRRERRILMSIGPTRLRASLWVRTRLPQKKKPADTCRWLTNSSNPDGEADASARSSCDAVLQTFRDAGQISAPS
jgi:hypothetical protein